MVYDSETSTSRCEQFWFDIDFHSLWHIGLFHARPPKFTVVQLEQQGVLTDIKIDNFLLFIPFLNNLSREVDRLKNLNTNLRLDPNLPRLIAAPTIQMSVTHQRHRVTFTRLDFLDGYFLLFFQVVEVLVLGRGVVVFVFTIAECAVFTVAEVVQVALRVDCGVELAAGGDSLDFFAFESSNFGWLDAGDVGSVSQRPSGVHEQVEEHSSVLTSIPKRINLPIFIQHNRMFLPTHYIFRLNVILFKILNQLRSLNLILMPETALPVVVVTYSIDFASFTDDDGMIGTDCDFKGLFGEDKLFRKGVFLPEEQFAGLKAEFVEDFSC